METKFTKAKEKSLNQYIEEKHTQEECIGFIDGYEKALKDSKAPEMFDRLKKLVEMIDLGVPIDTESTKQLLKEATEL